MNKTFKTMLALMAGAMVFTACSNDDELENINEQKTSLKPMTFTASMEGQGGTRAAIDGLDIKWVDGDRISIFDVGDADVDGNLVREFTLTDGFGTTSGTFEGDAAEATTYYALYPYMTSKVVEVKVTQDDAVAAGATTKQLNRWMTTIKRQETQVLEDIENSGFTPENQAIILAYLRGETRPKKEGVQRNSSDQFENVDFPAEQTATTGSADPNAMLMIGESDDYNSLKFKNVCAYVKVTPEFDCTAIRLISKGSESLAGTVKLDYNGGTPTASVTANGISKVSITGTIKIGETYYIAVLPATLNSGFTIRFVTTNAIYEKSTTKTLALARNNVINLGSFDTSDLTLVPIKGTAKRTGDFDVNWVQLWEDGPKFAEYNVGVTDGKAESYGGYYCWGMTIDKDIEGTCWNEDELGDNDTATKLWGGKWRLPTKEELQALINTTNCTVEWIDGSTKQYNNTTVAGNLFTGKGLYASNSVFLPAAGYYSGKNYNQLYQVGTEGHYWSSTPYEQNRWAYALYIYSSNKQEMNGNLRDTGVSVRAVLAE